MDLRLVFLGTAGAVPTIERAPSSVLLIRGGERFLIDCGEGTQRQLMRSVGMSRMDKIFITHMHGDHYLGLPGLLKTLSLMGREEPLEIYGPQGLTDLFRVAQRMFGRFAFPVDLKEVAVGEVYQGIGYSVIAVPTDHGLPSVGWLLAEADRPGRFHPDKALELGVTAGPAFGRLQSGQEVENAEGRVVRPEEVMDEHRPGRKILITGDTRPTEEIIQAIRGGSVLVHDATFTSDEGERALETRHSTAREAAQVAGQAEVELLVLTHISSRHSIRSLVSEARKTFPNTLLPDDFDHLVVPYPDKGRPRLIRGGEELPEEAEG